MGIPTPGLRVSTQHVNSRGLNAEEATAQGSPLTPAAVKVGLRSLDERPRSPTGVTRPQGTLLKF